MIYFEICDSIKFLIKMQTLLKKKKRNMIQMNLHTKQKQTHRQKANLWSPKGKGRRREKLELLELTYTHCYM